MYKAHTCNYSYSALLGVWHCDLGSLLSEIIPYLRLRGSHEAHSRLGVVETHILG